MVWPAIMGNVAGQSTSGGGGGGSVTGGTKMYLMDATG